MIDTRIYSKKENFIKFLVDIVLTVFEKTVYPYILENQKVSPPGGWYNSRKDLYFKKCQINLSKRNSLFLEKYRMHKQTKLFNCFGSVLLYFRCISVPVWVDPDQMEIWIKNFTIPTLIPYLNCIVCLRDKNNELIHAAIFFNQNLCWHKMGRNRACFMSLNEIVNSYPEAHKVEFLRIKD